MHCNIILLLKSALHVHCITPGMWLSWFNLYAQSGLLWTGTQFWHFYTIIFSVPLLFLVYRHFLHVVGTLPLRVKVSVSGWLVIIHYTNYTTQEEALRELLISTNHVNASRVCLIYSYEPCAVTVLYTQRHICVWVTVVQPVSINGHSSHHYQRKINEHFWKVPNKVIICSGYVVLLAV